MRWVKLAAVTACALGLAGAAPAPRGEAVGGGALPKFDEVVKVEFPAGGYAYTLAEVARGVKIPYRIVVARDYPGVIALRSGPSFHEPPGPSGLHPREQISGKGQFYCLMDFGLGAPPKEIVRTVKKGTYLHSIEWDGRNWTGPSDFGNPRGKPFPAGTYEVMVTLRGKVVAGEQATPYQITAKTKLVLK
jgi:hypothetical protein